ncbi:MAG: hypothetical protein AB7E52_02445 [Bdellovibrionales bacterium]
MSDQGEKIIHLAREMLRDGREPENKSYKESICESHNLFTLKAAALTAMIASFGSASVTHLIDEIRRPMNRYERVEIEALLFYAAKQRAMSQAEIAKQIEKHLSLTSIMDSCALDYKRIRDYLREQISLKEAGN